jgi:Excreted virulence factor EspC, type VII ESX diderm
MTGGQFHVDSSGLTPLSDIHSQVAQGLAQLVGGGGPQASDVAKSFGNIAFGLNSALDGASQSRLSAIQTTKTSGDTISELLGKAHQMYLQGDQQGADKLKAAAEALQASEGGGSGGAGSAGGSTGAGATGAGATGAGAAAGGGAEMAGQMASQVGQQVGQIAQGLTQSVQGLAQGLTQLPQQLMQGLQGIGGSATKGADSGPNKAHVAADANEKADGDKDKDGKPDDKRAEEERGQQSTPPAHADGAQPGRAADGGRAPVPPPTTERPQPAQTRPQQSSL